MANVLQVAVIEAILRLSRRGWSQRRIARELDVDRETVARYIQRATLADSNPAIPTAGSETSGPPNPAISTAGTAAVSASKPAISTAGRQSLCRRWRELIEAMIEQGLSAQRIWQDLREERGFEGAYESVKRYVRRFKLVEPTRVWRLECLPGEEAQVDFGVGAPVVDAGAEGRLRRTWVCRVSLSYSRKAYSESVYHQSTENFIRILENGFRAFGGVPAVLCLDNLRAAVSQADWYEPELNPKLESFCRHYGVAILPARPRRPQDKGKIEAGVKYVKNNALKARRFAGLAEENRFLAQWEHQVADQRIHGTTRKQVAALFALEKPHLRALPLDLFPCFDEGQRTVQRDGFVEVKHAYYEVPAQYIGAILWVRWDARMVRVFDPRMECVATHRRLEQGQFSRTLGAAGGRGSLAANLGYWTGRARRLGPGCARWADAVAERRGVSGFRVLAGLCRLAERHSIGALDAACARAAANDSFRLRELRALLETRGPVQVQTSFIDEHPIIRPLSLYDELIGTPPQPQPQEATTP